MTGMPFIVYMDETGDHTLALVDRDFPLFALVLLVCDVCSYVQSIVPAIYQLKMDFFGHECDILHSRDIRKAQGAFGFLTDPEKKTAFYDRVNDIMANQDYALIASVIRKQRHVERYGSAAANPYELAMTFALERLLPLLEDAGQLEVQIVAEARGKREDRALELAFLSVVNYGTAFIPAERFRGVRFRLTFRPKQANVVGTQMADLAAYPIARWVLDRKKPNPAFEIVSRKFYKGRGAIRGLKVFP